MQSSEKPGESASADTSGATEPDVQAHIKKLEEELKDVKAQLRQSQQLLAAVDALARKEAETAAAAAAAKVKAGHWCMPLSAAATARRGNPYQIWSILI